MTSTEDVFICSAFRTPIGNFNGQYTKIPASKLGSCVLFHCLQRASVDSGAVSEVIMGQVLTAGQGPNPARQAAVLAKIPPSVPATTLNMACGSGLKAIINGCKAIRCQEASLILAGGQENTTMSEHCLCLRGEDTSYGHIELKDTAILDGVTCSLLDQHLVASCENLAEFFEIEREVQDKYALMSLYRAMRAIDRGDFDNEVIPTHEHIAYSDVIIDEYPKTECSLEELASLRPIFSPSGCITSGNSTGLADAAAAVLLASASEVAQRSLAPQAIIKGFVEVACDPSQMGLAPIAAIKRVLEKVKWTLQEVDLFEISEVCAVQAMVCVNILDIDFSKVNISGGWIALGHPLGASGARSLVTLIHNLERLEKNKGIVTLCIGGGMALAVAVQRCEGFGYSVEVVEAECPNGNT